MNLIELELRRERGDLIQLYVQMERDKDTSSVLAKEHVIKIVNVKNQIKCVTVVAMERRQMLNVLIINLQYVQFII